MNTKFPVILTLVIGVSVLMFQASGAVGLLEHTSARHYESGAIVEDENGQYNINNSSAYGGQVNQNSDNSIAGVIIGSIPRMLSLLAIPGVLGNELQTMTPAPPYIATPIGYLFNIIVYIGGFQVVTGRYFE